MATTPEQFLKDNMKWIALIFFCLFMLKSIQGCNRNMITKNNEKESIHTIDSLNKTNVLLIDSIKNLNFGLRSATERATYADKRADAVQSTAEKIKSNTTTTVNVKGAVVDTVKNSNR